MLTGSPAINTGDNSICPATDARGISRSNGQCDAGAYEASSQGAAHLQPLVRRNGGYWLGLSLRQSTFKSIDRPDPGQLLGLIARSLDGDQITFRVEIEPG